MNNNHRPDPLNQAREIWATIVRKRWGILLTTVLLVTIAVVAITLLPDSYIANTTVLFDPQRLPNEYVEPTVTADPALRLNTLTQEVLSAERLSQISQQLHLYADSGKSPSAIVDQMRKDITVDMKPNPGRDMSAFGISYTYGDPETAAAVANRLAQSFIDWDLANRAEQAASTATFMTDQLQEAKQVLDNEQAKVQDYKQKHTGELPEQLQSNMQALTMLHTALQTNSEALNRLDQEKTMLTAVPESGHSAHAAPSERDRLETEQRNLQTELTTLRAQYTENYPDVKTTKERLDAVSRQLSQGEAGKGQADISSSAVRLQIIGRETERLQTERKSIVQRIDKYQAEVDTTPLREQEFDTLNRSYTNAREQYEGLLDKKFHAEMALDLERQQRASRFTVDPAQIPGKPARPNRLLLFSLAIPLCGLIPTGIAVAFAEIRGTVNSERALRAMLPDAARIMGSIPIIETTYGIRRQRRLAMLSILGSIMCFAFVFAFLWGGAAAHMRRNHAHQFNPATQSPSAELLQR
jgi:polysaccharide biosynthesis transport protein